MIEGILIKNEGITITSDGFIITKEKAKELYEDLKKIFGNSEINTPYIPPATIPWTPAPPWKPGDGTGGAPITLLYGVRTP